MNELIIVHVRGLRKIYYNRKLIFMLPQGWYFKGGFDFPEIHRQIFAERGRRVVCSMGPERPLSL